MISRKEAINELKIMRNLYSHIRRHDREWEATELAIEALSQPERPKGRWIEVPDKVWSHEFKCSCCGQSVYTTIGERRVAKWYPYCHCGADMRGEEE